MVTGPSALFSTDAALMPAEHAAPTIPMAAPVAPSPATARSTATAFDMDDFLGTQAVTRKAPAKPRGRWLVRLMMVGVLGAGGWAAYQYGPDLYDQYVAGSEESAPPETTAPLAFPNVLTTAPVPIRTAEFVLTGLPETPGAAYRVTTDFETNVSQVDITRDTGPDLQILTYGEDAMIRRADGVQWYLLDRGQFPLDGRLERSDWVRRIDELLPSNVRDQAIIDGSTESTISGVPTRHLSITVDPALLDARATGDVPIPTESATAGSADAETVTSATPEPASSSVPATGIIEIEVWIDAGGLVRQVTGAPQLGAETITVMRTSADAWIPKYPTPEEIAPLTATALVDLGI
jgi:hypothetical protein